MPGNLLLPGIYYEKVYYQLCKKPIFDVSYKYNINRKD